jgi:NodT family efflux transporter outer membrane factor (OMF) lipoprotein
MICLRRAVRTRAIPCALFLLGILVCGCTTLEEYVHNGFKVGPSYHEPPAPVAPQWIDAADKRVRSEDDDLSQWWTVFHDPTLDSLICRAYQQNLTLRQAGLRVLEARAQRNIDAGNLFPQSQAATGSYTRSATSRETAQATTATNTFGKRWFDQWEYGFNLNWELDFWGRFRRTVESSNATLDASVFNYDDVLVTLLGDVASNYVNLRTFQQRIRYAEENVKLQQSTVKIVKGFVDKGLKEEVDLLQARSILEQTQAEIPELQIGERQAANRLCILLGIPPQQLAELLQRGAIPVAPLEVALGIPADLIRRRPDVRRAERQAAAQSALIGVAETELYPHLAISGNLGYTAERFKDLFKEQAFNGSIGPNFQWNILNYGRLRNNVRLQDARFQELVAAYQNSVLSAAEDVEDGLVIFLKSHERVGFQGASVKDAEKAVDISVKQYKAGTTPLTTVTLLQQNLVVQQDTLAQSQAEAALGLIQVYRALGGGWELKCRGCDPSCGQPQGTLDFDQHTFPKPEVVPPPKDASGSSKQDRGASSP